MKKKKIVSFDLETIANPFIFDILPEVTAKGNLKDPEKIAADIQEKQIKQIADMGMDPMLNMICCAGWHSEDGPGSISIEEATYAAEKKLLIDFWEILSGYDVFVGFNSRAFDIRCMLLHGITHGLRPAIAIDHGKYNRGNHIDLRPILAGDGMFAKGKLDFFCKLFLGDQKTEGMTGDQVQSYFEMGLTEEIAEYCQKDCELTYRLYLRVEAAGLLE